jgi:hypothetical protein
LGNFAHQLLPGARQVAQFAWIAGGGTKLLRIKPWASKWAIHMASFFDPGRMAEFERRLGLAAGGFTSDKAVVFVCGLTATIRGVLVRLIDPGSSRKPR